ncbi:MAG: hypothetical protein BGO43_13385 [Gammaproteobacteria bacterium 39-13]|nr:hypothetical protein [Gammaproteobacteria bacterium]OJV85718.1 MAG: hypothetical protein BGO43_13385 [Gammaproteobacteria bacterium 39-13]
MHAIINLMQKLGYKVEYKGVCAGLTQMWVQAYFSGENEEFVFLSRIDKINDDFEKGKINENNIEQKLLVTENKIKHGMALDDEDIHLLEMRPFFDGVALYQLAKNAGENFFINAPPGGPVQTDVDTISKTTASKALENKAIIKVYNEPLACINANLQNFFDELKKTISENASDVVFTLSSGLHRIGLRFDADENKWVLINPGSYLDDSLAYKKDDKGNPLSLKETINKNLKFDHECIAKEIQAALSLEANSVANINAFVVENHPELSNIKSNFSSLNPPRENVVNRGITLIHLAVAYNNLSALENNIHFYDLDTRIIDTGKTALEIGLIDNHVECIRILVKHGANLKLTNTQGKTQLSIEIQEKKWENIIAVLSSIEHISRLSEKDLKSIKKKKSEIQKHFISYLNSISDPNKKKEAIEEALHEPSGLVIIFDQDFKKKILKLNAGNFATASAENAGQPVTEKKSKFSFLLNALKLKSENKTSFLENQHKSEVHITKEKKINPQQ